MLRTQGLMKKFGPVRALSDLTVEVPHGSVFALVGPNGAGKSTAIKICMNFVRATAGVAEVMGVDSRRLGPNELAQIGYMSENRQLPDWMRVGSFLSYCKSFYPNWQDNDCDELIRQFELPLDRPLKTLSRGMRVKAALTASLSYRPRLLILDEPFGGLDVLVREQLIESIIERSDDSTILLASHDLAEIETFATHVAYIDEGRIQFVNEMARLTERFREVEVVLDAPVELPDPLPSTWLNVEHSAALVRFTDSQYDASREELRRYFPAVRDLTVRSIPFRSIFIALAKSAKTNTARR
jgi:ABC-2 type transport system ATP-binding protein